MNKNIKHLRELGKTNTKWVDEFIDNNVGNFDLYRINGLDSAIIGISESNWPVLVYSYEECIKVFRLRDGMSEEDAVEHMHYNIIGYHIGNRTPMFIHTVCD